MTAEEFGEWQALYRISPWGEWSADLRAGIIASTMANVNRGENKKPYTPLDFMPLQQPAVAEVEDDDDFEPEDLFG